MYEKALKFATKAHEGQTRKGGNEPYINHPIEVSKIVQTMTEDEEVWVAALLHDTVEDTPVTIEDIEKEFGARVKKLVEADTEDKRENLPPNETWKIRKQDTIDFLKDKASIEEKIIVLSDKLSNARQLHRDYEEIGDEVWQRFNQKDKAEHAWYYRSVLENTSELKEYPAWQECKTLVEVIFASVL